MFVVAVRKIMSERERVVRARTSKLGVSFLLAFSWMVSYSNLSVDELVYNTAENMQPTFY